MVKKRMLIICNTKQDFELVDESFNEGFILITEPIVYSNTVLFFLTKPEEQISYKEVGYRMINSREETEINKLLREGYHIKSVYKDFVQLIKEVAMSK